jgi:hypothetical protein
MTVRTLHNLFLYQIRDEATRKLYYGCDQEWYSTKWKRLSGCGPTAVSNIIYYLTQTRSGSKTAFSWEQARALMEDVWNYVTPTMHGIPSTEILCKGIASYAKAKEMNIGIETVDIPKSRLERPAFAVLLSFLDQALEDDIPIAFLNLDHGEERNLDSWHWVTIVSLEQTGEMAVVEILDEGIIKRIDLSLWFHTTTKGGGFVRMSLN